MNLYYLIQYDQKCNIHRTDSPLSAKRNQKFVRFAQSAQVSTIVEKYARALSQQLDSVEHCIFQ